MSMLAIVFGALLVLVGVAFYAGTGATSVTALIPAFLGLPLCGLGFLARREHLRKHAMHGAATIGLLGLLGSLRGVFELPALIAGAAQRPAAVIAQTLTAALCLAFVALCVRSFVAARKARGA